MEFKALLRLAITQGDYTQREAAEIISQYARTEISLHTVKGWLAGNHTPKGARLRAAKRFIKEITATA